MCIRRGGMCVEVFSNRRFRLAQFGGVDERLSCDKLGIRWARLEKKKAENRRKHPTILSLPFQTQNVIAKCACPCLCVFPWQLITLPKFGSARFVFGPQKMSRLKTLKYSISSLAFTCSPIEKYFATAMFSLRPAGLRIPAT